MKQIIYEDYTIFVGNNAVENWDLIKSSKQRDIWLHLDAFSSPHVVIIYDEDKDKEIPRNVIRHAAILCREYSKHNNKKGIKVMYTDIKYVKLGIEVGEAIARKYKFIIV
jgi:predicted ribosome quality control (RQC) complex YloA/Tae2 family protein